MSCPFCRCACAQTSAHFCILVDPWRSTTVMKMVLPSLYGQALLTCLHLIWFMKVRESWCLNREDMVSWKMKMEKTQVYKRTYNIAVDPFSIPHSLVVYNQFFHHPSNILPADLTPKFSPNTPRLIGFLTWTPEGGLWWLQTSTDNLIVVPHIQRLFIPQTGGLAWKKILLEELWNPSRRSRPSRIIKKLVDNSNHT